MSSLRLALRTVARLGLVVSTLLVLPLASRPAVAAEVQVTVRSNSFSPEEVTISPGDTVTWTNSGGFHSVQADDGSFSSGAASSARWTISHTFDRPGTNPYYCIIHGGPNGFGMSGRVIVAGATGGGTIVVGDARATVGEGGGTLGVRIRRTGTTAGAVSVRVRTQAGSATPGADFGAVDSTVTWADGDGADKIVDVPIFQDTATEGNESFTVALSAPTGGATLGSPSAETVTIADDDGASGACTPDATTLCLVGGRFRVQASWHNQYDGSMGTAKALPRTDLTGFFWFTDSANVELIVKVLDFGDVVKVFYGQLTDLHFELTVTDTQTGAEKTYVNGPDNCGAIDNEAFFKNGIDRGAFAKRLAAPKGKAGTCVASATRLCLLDKRFAVDVAWRNQFNDDHGAGKAVPYTDLSGLFSFTDPSNVELMAKTLDFGGGRILFLWGALSNLEYSVTLTDTTTGESKRYDNPAGRYCGGIDPDAF